MLLFISILINLGVAADRFTTKDLRITFVMMCISKHLFLATLTVIIVYKERETRKPGTENNLKWIFRPLFIPQHLFFIATLVIGFIPEIGAYCHPILHYPLVFIIMEFFFGLTLFTTWVLHCADWMTDWNKEGLDTR